MNERARGRGRKALACERTGPYDGVRVRGRGKTKRFYKIFLNTMYLSAGSLLFMYEATKNLMKTKPKRASRAKVRRLRFRGPDGKMYQRTQAVENDIAITLPLPHPERAARAPFALNETLIYFIRRCDDKEELYYDAFLDELIKRLVDLADRYVRRLRQDIGEDIVGRVRTEFLQLVLDERNSRKVEFLEVSLAHAVQQRTLDIVRLYLHSPWGQTGRFGIRRRRR